MLRWAGTIGIFMMYLEMTMHGPTLVPVPALTGISEQVLVLIFIKKPISITADVVKTEFLAQASVGCV